MIIERKIRGEMVQIELTDEELWLAYREVEHKLDIQDIEDELENYLYEGGDEDFYEEYKVPFSKVYQNDEIIDRLATEKRRNQDKYQRSLEVARDEAFKEVLYDYQEEEEQSIDERLANAAIKSEKGFSNVRERVQEHVKE